MMLSPLSLSHRIHSKHYIANIIYAFCVHIRFETFLWFFACKHISAAAQRTHLYKNLIYSSSDEERNVAIPI